ncbi:MAG TPA: mannitol dehydrogenase family protein [Streptosporangiaceae bacterium]|nr:mannitol dehydrogenase family protein [Streptosporangiaceae bacterium]
MARSGWRGRAGAPVRMVHLGLGNFFRAHQAWYTEHAADAGDWGYAAFTGRNPRLAEALRAQGGTYTLVTRAIEGDEFELVNSLSAVHPADDQAALADYFRRPELALVTLTVTEAGYHATQTGRLDGHRPAVAADLEALRADLAAPVRTAPAKLIIGLAARREADAGPLAIVPCDNLLSNGALTRRILGELAALIDDGLAAWITESVSVVTTMVDRITPPATEADELAVLRHTGRDDRCPVTTEPFTEWALSGHFPVGRPRWQDAGAIFTADVVPFEKRKLWMLNATHSLLAYAGSIIGHGSVADAVADEVCQGWLDEWWTIAAAHLDQPAGELAGYRAALFHRFENAAMGDRLDRIAADGSQKLPVRVLPVLRAERQAGRAPAAATRTLGAWLCHLRGLGAAVNDARADEVLPLARGPLAEAAPRVLRWLDPELAEDREVVEAVIDHGKFFSQIAEKRSRGVS